MSEGLITCGIYLNESGVNTTATPYSYTVNQTFYQSGTQSLQIFSIPVYAASLAIRFTMPNQTIYFTNSDHCSIINSTWGFQVSGPISKSTSVKASSTSSTSVVIPGIDVTFTTSSDTTLYVAVICRPTSGYSGQTITWTNQIVTATLKAITISI